MIKRRLVPPGSDEWRERAACAGHDTAAFFDLSRADEAIAVCATCPVIAACRATADHFERGLWPTWLAGVWAGERPSERLRRRRAARGA